MELRVPESFYELLASMKNLRVRRTLELLLWAHQNPRGAAEVAEAWKALGEAGKRELEHQLFYEELNPPSWIEAARKTDEQDREEKAFMNKFRAAMRRGSYRFKLPSGTECMVRKRHTDTYDFVFTPGGEKVVFTYASYWENVSSIVRKLENGEIETPSEIIYNNERYFLHEEAGKKIMKAVEENISPGTLALLGSPDA